MAEDGIFIPIEVRLAKLDSGLREAEARIAASSKKMEATAGGGATGFAVKSLYVIGGIKAGLAGITAATAAWSAKQAEANGRIEDAHRGYMKVVEAVRSVPIVGGIAGGIANLFTGWQDDIDDATSAITRMNRELQKVRENAERARDAIDASAGRGLATARETSLVGVTGFDRERREAENQAAEKTTAAMKAALEAKGMAEGNPLRQKLLDDAEKEIANAELLLATKKADINEREKKAKLKQEADFHNKRLAQERAAADKQRQLESDRFNEAREAEAKNQKDLTDLRSEATVNALRAQGKDSEAEAEAIRHKYQTRIDAAREGGNEEQAALLEIMRDMDVRGAQAKGSGAGGGRGIGLTASNFRGSGSSAVPYGRKQSVEDQKLADIARQMLAELKKKKPATAG